MERARAARRRACPRRLLGAAVVLAFVGSVPTTLATAVPSAAPATLAWRSCGEGFECSTLPVPLDDSSSNGPAIDLAVLRAPARDAKHRIGVLLMNPGGPGVSAVDFLRGIVPDLPSTLRDRFDLVAFDPRGVGASGTVHCEDSLDTLFDQPFSPSNDAQRAALVNAFRSLAAACAARNGTLLAHVSTLETARDMDRLRVALGASKVSYLGFSYGTYLGALYASNYPDRVRAFVLDGAIDPSLDADASTLGQARGFEQGLDAFLAYCSAHSSCVFHHGGRAEAAYDALRARTARAPIRAAAYPGRALNESRFDAAVVQALYLGRASWSSLARALRSAEDGDSTQLLVLADTFIGRDSDGHVDHALDAFWAITCRDGPVVGDLAAAEALERRAAEIAPRLGRFLTNNSLACSVWPVPPLPSPGKLTAPGAPPILVLGATHDPATPLLQAKALASSLHGVLLVAPGEQHTSFDLGNACVDRAVVRYFVAVSRPSVRRCPASP